MKLAPFQYIHVMDKNRNVTRIEEGPKNFVKLDQEDIVTGTEPLDFIVLKPYTYALINDPAIRKKDERIVAIVHDQLHTMVVCASTRQQDDKTKHDSH